MIKTNEEVIKSWICGRPDFGKSIKTNGKDLFSSELKIGFTIDGGVRQVYAYKDEFFVSDATTRHIILALKMLGLEENAGIKPPEKIKRDKKNERKNG